MAPTVRRKAGCWGPCRSHYRHYGAAVGKELGPDRLSQSRRCADDGLHPASSAAASAHCGPRMPEGPASVAANVRCDLAKAELTRILVVGPYPQGQLHPG